MRVEAQPAFVLHSRPWRETSLLLEVFSRDHGRVGLLARSVRGPRARLSRAILEPFHLLQIDWAGQGDLPNLRAAETVGVSRRLSGDVLLSGLYVNELLVRLTARHDPHPQLFARYASLLEELGSPVALAWNLRRFERDLLAEIGYALQLEHESESEEPLDAEAEYLYAPEQGPLRASARSESKTIRGAALLALREDTMPVPADLIALRRLLRAVIGEHVGERGLRAWRVLAGAMRKS
ncbi:MAG: DNA repair protein RecO [Rhodanobacteraceae bacterium]